MVGYFLYIERYMVVLMKLLTGSFGAQGVIDDMYKSVNQPKA